MVATLLTITIPQFTANAKENSCTACTVSEPADIVSEAYNENGNLVTVLDNGVEITYLDDGKIIIKDYQNAFKNEIPNTITTRSGGLLLLGKVIFNVLGACSMIPYLAGEDFDLCRIVINALKNDVPENSSYFVYGEYIPGYIPGCEPRYSAPCNQGYWVYEVSPA